MCTNWASSVGVRAYIAAAEVIMGTVYGVRDGRKDAHGTIYASQLPPYPPEGSTQAHHAYPSQARVDAVSSMDARTFS